MPSGLGMEPGGVGGYADGESEGCFAVVHTA
jgi:hypothetical protein